MKAKQAALVLLVNKNKVLLYLRDNIKNIPYPNYWSFLGGGIEAYETPINAAKRELMEEVGVKVDKLSFIDKLIIRNDPLTYDCDVYLFLGDFNYDLNYIILNEGQKIQYFNKTEINDLKNIPAYLKSYCISYFEGLLKSYN